MIKKVLLSGACVIALTSYANAADVAPAPVANWTGFYLGVNAGLAGGDFDYDLDYDYSEDFTSPGITDYAAQILGAFSLDSSGLLAGGQIGYNWQVDHFVFGAEADFQWTGLEGDIDVGLSGTSTSPPPGGSSFAAGASAGSEVDWFGTLRLRAGYTVTDAFLAYVTGGAAYGKVESGYNLSLGAAGFGGLGGAVAFSDSTSDNQWGWTLGGGAEYMINDNWSFKAEYLYVDLGSQTLYNDNLLAGLANTGPNRISTVSDSLKIDVDTAFHTVKVGVNYKFW